MKNVILGLKPVNGRPIDLGRCDVHHGQLLFYVGDSKDEGIRCYIPFDLKDELLRSLEATYNIRLTIRRECSFFLLARKFKNFFGKFKLYTRVDLNAIREQERDRVYKELMHENKL